MNKLFVFLLVTNISFSQVGIGTTSPDPSSILDIESNNLGLLIPRLSENQKNNILNPAQGLLVYQSDAEVGFWYYNGSAWIKLEVENNNWSLTGNSNLDDSVNFMGSTNGEDVIIKANDTERIKIHANTGNVGLSSTLNSARLHVTVGTTESVPNYGIRNDYLAVGSGTKYALYNRNNSNSNGTHYGIYNYTSGGSGIKYGIYNQTTMGSSSSSILYGIRNNTNSSGSGIQYGTYTNMLFSNSLTANVYGQYTRMDYSAGIRYGAYKDMNTNTITNGTAYGDYNRVYGSGNGDAYGVYTAIENTGSGIDYGTYNYLSAVSGAIKYGTYNRMHGDGTKYGTFNNLVTTNSGIQYGTFNSLAGDNGDAKYGVYNNMYSDDGNSFGVYNLFWRQGSEDKYGIYNQFANTEGQKDKYGVYNRFTNANSNGDLYGTYTEINNSGLGDAYGIYVDVAGGSNDYAAFFKSGNIIANEDAGNYDFRVETQNRPNALLIDASANAVKIGDDLPSFADDGVTIGGTTIDYVASFYNGQTDGTTIGIGENAYLLEGIGRVKLNRSLVAAYHLQDDLGYSTTEEAWDDVYADDFVNISDVREKEQIEPIAYGLDEIMQLRPISYTLKKDPYKETKLGLEAQQVLGLIAEAVKTHDHKISDTNPNVYSKIELERYGMKYNYIIPVLIKAIQEQQLQIKDLKKELEIIKKKSN